MWILEHPLTFTGGIRSKENEILDKKIKIIKTNRGGKITFIILAKNSLFCFKFK